MSSNSRHALSKLRLPKCLDRTAQTRSVDYDLRHNASLRIEKTLIFLIGICRFDERTSQGMFFYLYEVELK